MNCGPHAPNAVCECGNAEIACSICKADMCILCEGKTCQNCRLWYCGDCASIYVGEGGCEVCETAAFENLQMETNDGK